MALREIIEETQANLRADAANAKAVFSVDSKQVENLRSEAQDSPVLANRRRAA